ncbi:MAG: hypothetical protein EXQ56_02100 [Acidobacteria bacterium]|nr:hypothetical protein [Acidobacteriota bacterium]
MLGAGGSGEVYTARDTRLDRNVAIKVLPLHLASLNHPHICTLFDIGRDNGIDYLVLEYLEGETLPQKIGGAGFGVRDSGQQNSGKSLPLDEMLQYAIEIADALDKAHRKGITHRDLKSGNIMLVKSSGSGAASGYATKLLDFGLAKLRQEAQPNVPLEQSIKFIVKFEDRPGMWMTHCHIRDHAEGGLMGRVHLVGDS